MSAPFPDLVTGGRELARALEHYRGAARTIVLAIVRGGVPAGIEVARHLELPLDVILRQTLLLKPDGESMGATSVAGTLRLHPDITPPPPDPRTPLQHYLTDTIADLQHRVVQCRGDRAPVDVSGKTVIVVDNGMRTGGTMRIGVRAVRALGAKRIIAASPVGTPETRAGVEEVTDEVVCLQWLPLGNVAMGYRKFDVPVIESVAELIAGGGK